MKIGPLLAQYFYSARKLDIPGIGSLYFEGSIVSPNESSKETVIDGVRFEYNKDTLESPELVRYIAEQTGKIKALSAADLESYWEQAKQFLHIGKPFLLEGIGSLQKLQAGGYGYTPGIPIHERMMDHVNKEVNDEEANADYKTILYLKKIKGKGWKRPVAIILFVAGLGAAIWGGYELSKRNTAREAKEDNMVNSREIVPAPPDTVRKIMPIIPDTLSATPINSTAGYYRFIVETALKPRAFKRYDFLRKNGINIQMETKDSIQFSLFFDVPVAIADTSHILDSLQRFYTPVGKHAYIQK